MCEETGGFDDDEHLRALALFSAHVEAEELPEGFLDGPQRAPEAEAVAWAREHAAKVVVRTCETWENVRYSAGQVPVKDAEPWPEGGVGLQPRRLPGWEFVDRTENDDPIAWDIAVGGLPSDLQFAPGFEEKFRRALDSDPSIELLDLAFTPPALAEGTFYLAAGEILAIHVRVTGRTVVEAAGAATRACDAAAGGGWEWTASAYPAGSRAGRANARLRER